MSDETFEWLIEQAVSWEQAARELYLGLSAAFASHDGIQRFWKQMADDEASHIRILRSVQSTLPHELLSEPIGTEVRATARAIDELLTEARDTPLASLNDVYELAHQLESSEINSVFRLVALDTVDDPAKRALLAAQFDEHLERLEGFGSEYGPAARRSIYLEVG